MQTFFVEPEIVELAIGETKEIRVWAFPPEVKTYKVRVQVQTAEEAPDIVNVITSAHSEPSRPLGIVGRELEMGGILIVPKPHSAQF